MVSAYAYHSTNFGPTDTDISHQSAVRWSLVNPHTLGTKVGVQKCDTETAESECKSFFKEKTFYGEDVNQKGCCEISIYSMLILFNALGAVGHLIGLLSTLFLSQPMNTPRLPLYYTTLKWIGDATPASVVDTVSCVVPANATGLVPLYLPVPEDEDLLSLPWLVAGFFAISFFFHTLILILIWIDVFYLRMLHNCEQPLRFVEYAFSASVMIVAITYTSGRRGVTEIAYAFVLMFATMGFGWCTEAIASCLDSIATQRRSTWTCGEFLYALVPWLLGCVTYVPVWCVLIKTFEDTVTVAEEENGLKPPEWVRVVVYGQCAVFSLFSLPQIIQLVARVVPDYDPDRVRLWYVNCEFSYIVLSLAAKLMLGFTYLANVLVLSNVGNFDEAIVETA